MLSVVHSTSECPVGNAYYFVAFMTVIYNYISVNSEVTGHILGAGDSPELLGGEDEGN